MPLASRYDGAVSSQVPEATHRWRCSGCGNLTRFDVTRTRRTTEFWHVDLAGHPAVEATDVLDEAVESVRCRWCGRDDAIERVLRKDVDAGAAESVDSPGV